MMNFIYRLLEIPIVYRVVTFLLGPGGPYLRKKINQKIFAVPARKVLDVGCGPVLTTPEPLEILVGLDLNEDCVRQYTGGYVDKDPSWAVHPPAGRKRLGYVGSALQLPFSDGCFDEIRSSSFFHHLSDAQTETALKEMERCVHSGGRLVMFDAVWPKRAWTRPIAWLVGKYDRGHYFRTEEQLAALFEKSCPGEWRWERHTYTFTGLELLCLQYEKK